MASAILTIAIFHAVLWVSLAVLTLLEPPHPERRLELVARSQASTPAESPAEPPDTHDRGLDGESLRPAA